MNDRLVGALAFWAFLATFGWLTACDTLQTERRQVSQWYDAHVCVPKGGR